MKIKAGIIVVTGVLGVFASVALVGGALQKAQDATVSTIDAGFVPSTGQINLGYTPKLPSSSLAREIPSSADARAAYFASERLTTGAASFETEVITPIGASPADYTGEVLQHSMIRSTGFRLWLGLWG